MVSSQACPDNLFNSFDLCEETFSSIFQNVKPCQYLNPSCLPIHCNNNKLILLHLNMRSLQKNYDDLHAFLSDLPCKPHIISISETKIKDKPLTSISLPGYIFLHKNSVSNAGGVGVYISDLLQFNEITFKATFPGCESLWINLNSSNNESNYVIGTVVIWYLFFFSIEPGFFNEFNQYFIFASILNLIRFAVSTCVSKSFKSSIGK